MVQSNEGVRETTDNEGFTPFLRAVKSNNWYLLPLYFETWSAYDRHQNDGNTALHIALQSEYYLSAETLLGSPRMYWLLNEPNKKGVTPLDIIGSLQYLPSHFEKFLWKKGLLVGYRIMHGVPSSKIEACTNTIGVIAALLATVTFTAAFTVPGGLTQDSGTPILLKKTAFQVFMASNTLALCLSMMVLFCLLCIMATPNKSETILLVGTSILLLKLSFYLTLFTFMMGVYVTTINTTPWIAYLSCALCSSLILLMHRWFIKDYIGPTCTRLSLNSARIKKFITTTMENGMWYTQIKSCILCKCLEDGVEESTIGDLRNEESTLGDLRNEESSSGDSTNEKSSLADSTNEKRSLGDSTNEV